MPVPSSFVHTFQSYLGNARVAQAENRHHDYRRQIFLDFLKQAFNIASEDVDVERFIKFEVRGRGWIDALFRDLVFEFKRDFARERDEGIRELRDYLRSLPYGAESIGLLTDGLLFEVFTLEEDDLRQVDQIDLAQVEAETAFLWLDSYLFSQKGVPPTSADLVRRFGADSPTFHAAARVLEDLLRRVENTTALNLKRQLWRSLLAKVYGSDIASDELFIRHTYLNQFAKLLAYTALHGIPHQESILADIVSGKAFHDFGVSNLGEIDFFSWILEDDVRADALGMLRRLAQSLVVYDLTRINEDLFKQLYQNLVDPETRHKLGEYYTPDWLAELTLREIDYRPGQRLLDPSCGSGTFLFTAIRLLAEKGLQGWELIDFALDHIAGLDVNPLAVTIARINYLLAIIPHMRGEKYINRGRAGLMPLPIYMADSLQMPEENGVHHDIFKLPVDLERDEHFFVPKDAAQSPTVFSDVIEHLDEFARLPINELYIGGMADDFIALVQKRFGGVQRGLADLSKTYWSQNLRLLNRLIHEQRDSIWTYMLKNAARPLLMMAQKFDVVAGNPPWLTYGDIQDKTYQAEVRELTLKRYQLLDSKDRELFTQMELATLFMVHCETVYLREGGVIAFVMPRSTITGSKQHRRFQSRGVTRILDTKEVAPLFNTESAVLIRRASEVHSDDVPTTRYQGRLPAHEIAWSEASPHLKISEGKTRLVGEVTVASPHYYDLFKQGASLVPRNLCFVSPVQMPNPGDAAFNPTMETDPDVDAEAKAPWKGLRLHGPVYPPNLYATLLSKNLLPFGVRRLHLVALPFSLEEGALKPMALRDFMREGYGDSWRFWFTPADEKWTQLKKATSRIESLIDQYDYQRKLTSQHPKSVYKVLYNSSGTHISACVMDTHGQPSKVYEYPTQGFVADSGTYWFDTDDLDEGHFLCSLLNAACVDKAIKIYQPRGIYKGERHIQRTPFEACAIPPYDTNDDDHKKLVSLSKAAHDIISNTTFTGSVYKARDTARAAVKTQLEAIDVIARRILGLS